MIKFFPFCVQSGISRYFCVVSIEGPELKCVKMMWFWVSAREYDRVCVTCVGDKLILCVFVWYWMGRKYLGNIVAGGLSTVCGFFAVRVGIVLLV